MIEYGGAIAQQRVVARDVDGGVHVRTIAVREGVEMAVCGRAHVVPMILLRELAVVVSLAPSSVWHRRLPAERPDSPGYKMKLESHVLWLPR